MLIEQQPGADRSSLNDRATSHGEDQDCDDNSNSAAAASQPQEQQVTGDRTSADQMNALEGRHTSQSDDDNSRSSAGIKRTKLTHMERNHDKRLAI